MKQEDKDLLLKDLCARLPYRVIVTDNRHGDSRITEIDTVEETVYCDDFDEYVELDKCKPYLRPMSSMTEEEKHELYQVFQECPTIIKTFPTYAEFFIYADIINSIDMVNVIDWLNAHHFDYRGLIKKGLAIEAPAGMYEYK